MSTTATIEQRVIECVHNVVGKCFDDITAETQLAYDLGFDSLDYVEMAYQIEREFSINTAKIAPPDHDDTTVADLIRFVEANQPR